MFFQIEKTYDLLLLNPTQCPKIYNPDEIAADWGNKKALKCYCEQTYRGTLQENM